jgi:excisionase family DNA binding protein
MLTTEEVAAALRVSPRRVRALAEARGVKPVRVVGRAYLWPKNAVRLLRPGKPGRPVKV